MHHQIGTNIGLHKVMQETVSHSSITRFAIRIPHRHIAKSIVADVTSVKSGHHGLQPNLAPVVYNELKRIESEMASHPETILEDTSTPTERATAFLEYGEQSGYQLNTENPPRFVLVMDEINRGNISKIFGELITLIEADKRIGADVALTATLPLSQKAFALPPNLYLLGTMNTADKSIALVDIALRRRFAFVELMPDFGVCDRLTSEMRDVLDELNRRIVLLKDRDHQIGHAFFKNVNEAAGFERVWKNQIVPLLQEYFWGEWETLRTVLGESETGRLILPLANPSNLSAVRNKWQWHTEVNPDATALDMLRQNYGLPISSEAMSNAGDE